MGVHLAQLAIVTLGVLFASGEYSTGRIQATFSAVPRRLRVVWAKAIVFGAVTLVVGLVGVAGHLMLIGIMASAMGFILRNTAGGITALVALLLVIPGS